MAKRAKRETNWVHVGMVVGGIFTATGGSHYMTSSNIDGIKSDQRAQWAKRHSEDSLRDELQTRKLDTIIYKLNHKHHD